MAVVISILIPVFNEAENILPLAQEVAVALQKEQRPWELVFVDDASVDSTWKQIAVAHQADSRVRGLKHAHNCGQSAAVWTGILFTTSPVLATLDGDRQNDPADLPMMLEHLRQYDFVCGMRLNRRDTVLRRLSSRISWWARERFLGASFRDTGCGMRVFRRSALDGVFPFNGLHRFLPILVHGNGAKTVEVPVHHRPRVAGVSKYGVWNRLGRGVYDLIGLAWYQKRRYRAVPVIGLDNALIETPSLAERPKSE